SSPAWSATFVTFPSEDTTHTTSRSESAATARPDWVMSNVPPLMGGGATAAIGIVALGGSGGSLLEQPAPSAAAPAATNEGTNSRLANACLIHPPRTGGTPSFRAAPASREPNLPHRPSPT